MAVMGEPEKDFITGLDGRKTVYVVTAIIVCIGAAFAYWMWPTGINGLTFFDMTFDQMLWAAAAIETVFLTLGLVFCLVL